MSAPTQANMDMCTCLGPHSGPFMYVYIHAHIHAHQTRNRGGYFGGTRIPKGYEDIAPEGCLQGIAWRHLQGDP